MPSIKPQPWIQPPKANPYGLGLYVAPQKRDKNQLFLFTNICHLSPCRSLSAQLQSAHHSPLANREALTNISSGLEQSRRSVSKHILFPDETSHGFYPHSQSNVKKKNLFYKPADLHVQPHWTQGSFSQSRTCSSPSHSSCLYVGTLPPLTTPAWTEALFT